MAACALTSMRLAAFLCAAALAGALRPCEEERLRRTAMEPYGTQTDTRLTELGVGGIYVTTYSPLKDRRQRMQARFDQLGWRVLFVTGWDRELLTDEDVACMYPSNALFQQVARAMNFKLTWMRVGELSLCMKHAAAYYDGYSQGYRHIMVFEDDAFFPPEFKANVHALLSPAGGNLALPRDYQLVYMCNYVKPTERDLARPQRVERVLLRRGVMHGACGYMLSQSGVKWLMDHMPYKGPADLQLAHADFPSAPPKQYTREPWISWPDKIGRQQTQKQSPRFCRTPDLQPCWGKTCPRLTVNLSAHIIGTQRHKAK